MATIEDVVSIFNDFYGEDRVDVQENTYIIVHFPEVTVSNERGEQILIKHLYAKIGISLDGSYNGVLEMIRSEFTKAQYIKRYMHSHLPRFSTYPEWESPCLGIGPIRTTLASLLREYSEELWELFCLELKKFTETESLDGGPYLFLRDITSKFTSKYYIYKYNYEEPIYNELIKEFTKYIVSKKPFTFSFCEGYRIAMKESNLIITLSNLFIDWCNSLDKDTWENYNETINSLLVKGKYNKGEVHVLETIDSSVDAEQRLLLNFKGKPVKLAIVEEHTEDENLLTLLDPRFAGNIIFYLTNLINFNYANFLPYSEITEYV